jgi:hypothetical protein
MLGVVGVVDVDVGAERHGMGGSRKDVPGGVGDIKRISERVAGRTCKRMRTLLQMGEGGLEVL